MNILRQIAVYGILACGMAFTMMTGGIDLTVGSIAGVSGAVVARLMVENSVPLLLAMLAGILIGAALGLICGTTIAYTGIPPFIMTLGFQITLRGVCYLITEGKPIGNLPENGEKRGLIPNLLLVFLFRFSSSQEHLLWWELYFQEHLLDDPYMRLVVIIRLRIIRELMRKGLSCSPI